jgi:hypothetical protein
MNLHKFFCLKRFFRQSLVEAKKRQFAKIANVPPPPRDIIAHIESMLIDLARFTHFFLGKAAETGPAAVQYNR